MDEYESLEEGIQKLWAKHGLTVITEEVKSLGGGTTQWKIIAERTGEPLK